MSEIPPEVLYQRLVKIPVELFRMSQRDAIFLVCCNHLQKAGEIQFYKAAEVADAINEILETRKRLLE